MDNFFFAAKFVFTGMLIYRATLNLGRLDDMTKRATSKGIPAPRTAVIVGMIWLIVGALSILTGVRPLIGGFMAALFLLLSGYKIHDYWRETEPRLRKLEMFHFEKNLGLAAAALAIAAAS